VADGVKKQNNTSINAGGKKRRATGKGSERESGRTKEKKQRHRVRTPLDVEASSGSVSPPNVLEPPFPASVNADPPTGVKPTNCQRGVVTTPDM
jgi:hypothetical protein